MENLIHLTIQEYETILSNIDHIQKNVQKIIDSNIIALPGSVGIDFSARQIFNCTKNITEILK